TALVVGASGVPRLMRRSPVRMAGRPAGIKGRPLCCFCQGGEQGGSEKRPADRDREWASRNGRKVLLAGLPASGNPKVKVRAGGLAGFLTRPRKDPNRTPVSSSKPPKTPVVLNQ